MIPAARAMSALVPLVISAAPLVAQSAQRLSLQLSGLSVGPSGEAYAALEPAGPAGELQLRVTPGVWSFGIGGQRSRHGSSEEGVGDQQIVLRGVLVQLRRIVDVTAKDCGVQLNAGGVLVRLSPRVNLDVGDTFGILGFGDVLVDVPGAGRTTVG